MGILMRPEPAPKLPAYGWRGTAFVTVVCAVISGCNWFGDLRQSELSTYEEPSDGATARVRLIGSRPKVYPNSDCVSVNVANSGYPQGLKLWGPAPRTLGMPQSPDTPRNVIEVVARANVPMTISFQYARSSYTPGPAGTGAPGTNRSAHCTIARTFVPEAGADYEVRGLWFGNSACAVEVTELVTTYPHDRVLQLPTDSAPAFGCPDRSHGSPHAPSASP